MLKITHSDIEKFDILRSEWSVGIHPRGDITRAVGFLLKSPLRVLSHEGGRVVFDPACFAGSGKKGSLPLVLDEKHLEDVLTFPETALIKHDESEKKITVFFEMAPSFENLKKTGHVYINYNFRKIVPLPENYSNLVLSVGLDYLENPDNYGVRVECVSMVYSDRITAVRLYLTDPKKAAEKVCPFYGKLLKGTVITHEVPNWMDEGAVWIPQDTPFQANKTNKVYLHNGYFSTNWKNIKLDGPVEGKILKSSLKCWLVPDDFPVIEKNFALSNYCPSSLVFCKTQKMGQRKVFLDCVDLNSVDKLISIASSFYLNEIERAEKQINQEIIPPLKKHLLHFAKNNMPREKWMPVLEKAVHLTKYRNQYSEYSDFKQKDAVAKSHYCTSDAFGNFVKANPDLLFQVEENWDLRYFKNISPEVRYFKNISPEEFIERGGFSFLPPGTRFWMSQVIGSEKIRSKVGTDAILG